MSRTNYNAKGQIQSALNPLGHVVIYSYDKYGQQISVERDGDEVSCCSTSKTFYNKQHQTFAVLQADGKLTIYGYDKLGRQDRSYLGALVDVTKGEYKIEGLPLNEEFDIYVTKNKTDNDATEKLELGDLILYKEKTIKTSETVLTGKFPTQTGKLVIVRKIPMQCVERDFAGRPIASYDAKQNQTIYYHDSLGRQVATIPPPAGEDNTRLAIESYFDLSGNRIAQIAVPFDANLKPLEQKKRVTRIEHDQLGRATKIIQPSPLGQGDGPTTHYEYDLLGNIIKATDPLGNVTVSAHDNLGRKIQRRMLKAA
jgi:YD repeat-containing protein